MVPVLRLRDARRDRQLHREVQRRSHREPYAKTLDILFAMSGPAVDKFEASLKPAACSWSTLPLQRRRAPTATTSASASSRRRKSPKGCRAARPGAPTWSCWAFLQGNGLFRPDELIRLIDEYFEEHGKKNPQNAVYFMAGYNNT
jgi:hypothetical protein